MTSMTKLAAIAAAIVVAFTFAAPANAQATRTWISGTGDDANNCARTAPCKTWAGAISQTAMGGEIDCLDPGGFGAVTVTKSITLDCGGGIGGEVGSILVTGTNGITVNCSAAPTCLVKIRNMTIDGIQQTGSPGLSGIKFLAGAALVVEHVGIFGFGTTGSTGIYGGVDFEPNTPAKLSMHDVETQFGLGDGVLIKPQLGGSAIATLDHVSAMENAGDGVRVDNSNTTTGTGSNVTIFESQLSENSIGAQTYAFNRNPAATIQVTNSVVSGNGDGIEAYGSKATISIGGSTVSANSVGMAASSGKLQSFGDNYFVGNTTNGAPTVANLTKL